MGAIKDIFRVMWNGIKAFFGFITSIFKFIAKFLGWLGTHFDFIIIFAFFGFVLFLLYQVFKTENA